MNIWQIFSLAVTLLFAWLAGWNIGKVRELERENAELYRELDRRDRA